MGFFSWKTQDTGKSIPNIFSTRECFPVIMTDDNGHHWEEIAYEGYGVFGGKSYMLLVSEMNREFCQPDEVPNEDHGWHLYSSGGPCVFPSLTEDGSYHDGAPPELCERQGFFY